MVPVNYYEVLGVPATASPEQVDRAYRYHVSLYSDASLATYSLLDPAERQQAKAQVQEAYDVLKDPLRRRSYDRSQGIASSMSAPPPPAEGMAPPPSGAPVSLPLPIDGAALRRAREERGVSLEQIAVKSKIGRRYLEYLETERFKDLPARVYLRGFLMEYARALGLEPAHTADGYLESMGKR